MKKQILIILGILFSLSSAFSDELFNDDLVLVAKALDAKLFVDNYENYADKVTYVQSVESECQQLFINCSEEAQLIFNSTLAIQKENMKAAEKMRVEKENGTSKKDRNSTPDEESKKIIFDYLNKYEDYAAKHANPSSYFNYHYLEVKMSSFAYLSRKQQLEGFTNLIDGYKAIYEQNPKMSENLLALGMINQFLPGVLGGNKKEGKEQILQAIEYAVCGYEKASSCMLLSQIYFEDKKFDEANDLLDKALKIAPENRTLIELKKMNDAGYSMSDAEKYRKAKEKGNIK